ncbi:class I SAM-dependent methyltransferase [Nonomuraea cavernae]|uniref:class I SAM-dependent methyltransferase n=1 Tax=Nonomuraea cavernae TaxID=2045107 RepID=UPI0033FAB20A
MSEPNAAGECEYLTDVEDVYVARGTKPVVATLGRLAARRAVLELSAGSDAVGLALAVAGLDVTAIDSSAQVLDSLEGGAREAGVVISTLLGSIHDFQGGPYGLIYLLGNRISRLLSQDDQVACFANVSQALGENGLFVLETTLSPGCPDGRLSVGVADDRVVLHTESYDHLTQIRSMITLVGQEQATRILPSRLRHTSLAELDLMARLAGLDLKERWGTWTGDPATRFSPYVISVYALQTVLW